ncbi:MAG: hypothetical protein AB8D52_02895 [Gammaproteobacteria bacterium]
MTRLFFLLFVLLNFTLPVNAAPISKSEIPDPLGPWIDWVLQDQKQKTCPFIYNNPNQHRCAWPTRLDLSLQSRSGEFSITWHVYKKSWVTLPGDQKHWPVDVTDNGSIISITNRNGKPAALLTAGEHEIAGKFEWQNMPKALTIPQDTGLVSLSVNHKTIDFPDFQNGQLWIKQKKLANGVGEKIHLDVYRQIVDEIPMQITTRIDIQVSGKQREMVIGKPLLTGAIPLQLVSSLPARLEPDGSLRVQLRPGRWTIDLTMRLPNQITELSLPEQKTPWPTQEIWSFSAQNQLRLVEVSGGTSIDPQQTQMPEQWRQLPAFRMNTNDALSFNVIRRGDPEPEPDTLTLNRNLWLDQTGEGFTISDTINGRMTKGWRLEATQNLDLGRVILDGEPQFITKFIDKKGVEVRRGTVNLAADSRYEGDVSQINAVGWDHDFQQVRATLHLPPGWKLFSASGVDQVPDTWLQRWTLLDLFLVLITAIAISNLYNWRIGILALISLALLWHEPGSPKYIWLHIIAAIALVRVIPEGKFKALVSSYRNLSILVLILISIPFMINEIRIGLYPQVERAWQSVNVRDSASIRNQSQVTQAEPMVVEADMIEMEESMIRQERKSAPRKQMSGSSNEYVSQNRSKFPVQYDAKTNIQTGPGLPFWQWNATPLSWNGPVEKNQQIEFTLLSPRVNLLLNIFRVLLLAGLAFLIIDPKKLKENLPSLKADKIAAILLLPILFTIQPQDSYAEIPTPELLQELKTRLLAPAECLPVCANAPRMKIEVKPDSLQLRMEIHTIDDVIIPIPGMSGKWVPTQIAVNGEPASGLHKDKKGQLWISLKKGVHQLILFGQLPAQNSVDLALPLKPARVTFSADGWDIVGLHENGRPDNQLKLNRVKKRGEQKSTILEAATLPPFVQIHRTLRLGLDWRIETRVVRTSPTGTAIVLKVPMVEGESILSDGINIKDNYVLINMSANQSTIQWESSLKASEQIKLSAAETTNWTEFWYADISPIWHMETEGIAVVHHQNPDGRWLPNWRPWPGESVTLNITRPQGIDGQTLTIDSSEMTVTPGQRATDVDLRLSLRSSQGGQHTINLPELARLQSVTIDGKSQPIRQDGQSVTLPVRPGKQIINLRWRESEGIVSFQKTPEIDLATASVNHAIKLMPGRDRWVLLAGGPQWGPAVLFWGILIVILLVAIALGRIKNTPLTTLQWLLLAIGLSQAPIFSAVLVVAWLLAFSIREKLDTDLSKWKFNLIQLGLGALTFIALGVLFGAIQQGLLGSPEMQISGNGSNAYGLNWYQDRIANIPPQAWIFSVPLIVYRVLMLLWSLWLAFALLRWLRWGWECFSKNGLWNSFNIRSKKEKLPLPEQKTD